jgi:hypothetical protein
VIVAVVTPILGPPTDLDEALATIPAQVERGFTSICIRTSQCLDDPTAHAESCREVVTRVEALTT